MKNRSYDFHFPSSLRAHPLPASGLTVMPPRPATYYFQALPLTASAPGAGVTTLSIDGTDLLLLGADATYSPNPSVSGFLRFSSEKFGSRGQAEEALRTVYAATGEGRELMPLQAYPFVPLFAWVRAAPRCGCRAPCRVHLRGGGWPDLPGVFQR